MPSGPFGGPRPLADTQQVLRLDVEPRVQGEDTPEQLKPGRQEWLENRLGRIKRAELPPEGEMGQFNTLNVFLSKGDSFSVNLINLVVEEINTEVEQRGGIENRVRESTSTVECI